MVAHLVLKSSNIVLISFDCFQMIFCAVISGTSLVLYAVKTSESRPFSCGGSSFLYTLSSSSSIISSGPTNFLIYVSQGGDYRAIYRLRLAHCFDFLLYDSFSYVFDKFVHAAIVGLTPSRVCQVCPLLSLFRLIERCHESLDYLFASCFCES